LRKTPLRRACTRSRIKRSIRKTGGGFLMLGNLVSFVTSWLPVDVMFLAKMRPRPEWR
jgi:hypothetical protein